MIGYVEISVNSLVGNENILVDTIEHQKNNAQDNCQQNRFPWYIFTIFIYDNENNFLFSYILFFILI